MTKAERVERDLKEIGRPIKVYYSGVRGEWGATIECLPDIFAAAMGSSSVSMLDAIDSAIVKYRSRRKP